MKAKTDTTLYGYFIDEDIFVFRGPEWIMKISTDFLFWRSLNRCKAVMKNAFRYYEYMNEEELRRLYDFMEKEISLLSKASKDESFPKIQDKFKKLITYYNQEVEKHGM